MKLEKSTIKSFLSSLVLGIVFIIGADSSLCDDGGSSSSSSYSSGSSSSSSYSSGSSSSSSYSSTHQEEKVQKKSEPVFTNDYFEEDSVDINMNDVFDNSDY